MEQRAIREDGVVSDARDPAPDGRQHREEPQDALEQVGAAADDECKEHVGGDGARALRKVPRRDQSERIRDRERSEQKGGEMGEAGDGCSKQPTSPTAVDLRVEG